MTLCYVTDRKALAGAADAQTRLLLEKIESVGRAGVDWIQIREKDLGGRRFCELVEEAIRRVPASCRIIVNDRLDVAYVTGAGGVHLGEQSLPLADAKRFFLERSVPDHFLVGVSTHSVEAAVAAANDGADYVVFGPIHATPSKARFGEPQGVARLAEICGKTRVSVIAIGGMTMENAGECVRAGAAGIAAVRLFQEAPDLAALMHGLRS